jgi:hypothetical protein
VLPHCKDRVFCGCCWLGGLVRVGSKMCVVCSESGVWDEGW